VRGLQAQINELEAENSAQQAEIDALHAEVLRVFDGNGADIGPFVGFIGGSSTFDIWFDSVGARMGINANAKIQKAQEKFNFSNLDCEEPGFGSTLSAARIHFSGGGDDEPPVRIFVAQRTPSVEVLLRSQLASNGVCLNSPEPFTPGGLLIPLDEIIFEDIGLPDPLVPPLYVAPAPEAAP